MQVEGLFDFIALKAFTLPGTPTDWRVCASRHATAALGHSELHLLYLR